MQLNSQTENTQFRNYLKNSIYSIQFFLFVFENETNFFHQNIKNINKKLKICFWLLFRFSNHCIAHCVLKWHSNGQWQQIIRIYFSVDYEQISIFPFLKIYAFVGNVHVLFIMNNSIRNIGIHSWFNLTECVLVQRNVFCSVLINIWINANI